VLRTTDESPAMKEALRRAINAVDPNCPVYNVRSLDSQITKSLAPRRFAMSVIWAFATVALTLATVGVYGVMAYSVSRRTCEMGIRLALGASKNAVLALVFREGMSLVLFGTLLGVTTSLGLSRLLTTQLFGVGSMDPLTFSLVAILLNTIAGLACWLPARRAARVDPMVALRSE
jgi:putative ABC transport system permease protein